jgi:hypothetical protein
MTMNTPLFAQLKAACEIAAYPSWVEPATDDAPIAQMHVLLHVDDNDRNFMARLMVICDDQAAPDSIALLDMALIFPFPVQADRIADTARLTCALNLASHIGAFAVAEADKVIMLRAPWHAPLADMNAAHVMPLLDRLRANALESAPLLEQVASGALPFDEVLASVRAALSQVQQA